MYLLLAVGVEGLIFHKHLNANVFSIRFIPSKLQIYATYGLGYGVPIIIVSTVLLISSLTDVNHYVKENVDTEGNKEAVLCWLDLDSIVWAFIFPVALMILFNLGVVIMVVNVAYHSASHHRYDPIVDLHYP